jgi:CO/xanthine dehydrogenase Mo-binding subunit
VSALLGVPVASIDLVTGDTDRVSLGGGSHSGRSMRHAATLFAMAAPELIGKGKSVAAEILGTTADETALAYGRFVTAQQSQLRLSRACAGGSARGSGECASSRHRQ